MVKKLQQRDINKYYIICPSWRLEEYLDMEGRWNPDCTVFGAEKEDGTPQGLLLLQKTGEEAYEIGVLTCNSITQTAVARQLLQTAQSYVAVYGGGKLTYQYMGADTGTMEQLLRQEDWEESESCGIVYQIQGEDLQLPLKEEYPLNGEIILFSELPIEEYIRFSKRFGQDIEAFLDYRLCDDMDTEMSLAYMVEGRLAGYLLIRTWEDAMELNRFYIDAEHRTSFGAMVQRLYEKYKEHKPAIRTIYICAVNEVSDKLIQHLLGRRVLDKQYVKRAAKMV